MNSKIITFSGMTIAAVVLLFASGPTGNQQAIAYGHGFGNGFNHGFGNGFNHGYPVYSPCGGGPYTIVGGQIICTQGVSP
ncbi:MAG: hypothetical protein WA667_20575 [Candidatus Nitrosopolaris sp.]